MFETVMAACYLGINCITDLRRRQIYVSLGIAFSIGGILIHIGTAADCWQILFGIVLGLILAFIAWITGEAIGYGDVVCIVSCSMWVQPAGMIISLTTGFFLSALVSLALLIIQKKDRHDRIPFVPFLLLGYISQLVLMG